MGKSTNSGLEISRLRAFRRGMARIRNGLDLNTTLVRNDNSLSDLTKQQQNKHNMSEKYINGHKET